MHHPVLKATTNNIISLWFGADTPIRQYKIKFNPTIWNACQRVHSRFTPPSGASSLDEYRKTDVRAFAKAVLQELN